MSNLLVVVDVQNGFVKNGSGAIVPQVRNLVQTFNQFSIPVVFTRFINKHESNYVKLIHWSKLMDSPEIDIHSDLADLAHCVFDKGIYSAFTDQFKRYINDNEVQTIYICGIATDGCVLKTAVDAFEYGLEPIVVTDACSSHAGQDVHNAGLLLVSRFIGREQLLSSERVIDRIMADQNG